VLTFFAPDTGTHNLVHANADISQATQNREVIAFCDHRKAVSGKDPTMLVMDQKVTTPQVLDELDARGVTFATLRMRSPALLRHINNLTPGDYKTITLERPGRHNRPTVTEPAAVKLTNYPGTVGQLVVTGLGHEAPTIVIITNDNTIKTKTLTEQYTQPMTTEQRPAEIIQACCADTLPRTVNLNVDLNIVLCVLTQALLTTFRTHPGPGYTAATPNTIQQRFLNTPATILTDHNTITAILNRRAYPPIPRQSNIPTDTTVPWRQSRQLRLQFT